MGKRRRRPTQASIWVAAQDLPRSAAHPFYTRLNQILDEHDFDEYVEGLCQRFYADDGARAATRPLLPVAADRLFRRLGRRARDCVAGGRFVCPARVSRTGVARRAARSFDDLPDTSLDRSRDARGGLHLDSESSGYSRGSSTSGTASLDAFGSIRRRRASGRDGRTMVAANETENSTAARNWRANAREHVTNLVRPLVVHLRQTPAHRSPVSG